VAFTAVPAGGECGIPYVKLLRPPQPDTLRFWYSYNIVSHHPTSRLHAGMLRAASGAVRRCAWVGSASMPASHLMHAHFTCPWGRPCNRGLGCQLLPLTPAAACAQGPIHFATISTDQKLDFGSEQRSWLEADLAAVDRSITPWVVINLHRSMYNDSEWRGGCLLLWHAACGMRRVECMSWHVTCEQQAGMPQLLSPIPPQQLIMQLHDMPCRPADTVNDPEGSYTVSK